MIGCKNMKVTVIGQLVLFSIHFVEVCQFRLRLCMSHLYSAGSWQLTWALVLSLCTSFLMLVVFGSLCCK